MATKNYSSRQPRYSTTGSRRSAASRRRARPMGRPAAKRRGPAPIIIIVAVIAVIVTCWVFGRGCGTSNQARQNDKLKTYTTDANQPLGQSAAIAKRFNALANSVKQQAKATVDSQLGQMETDCKSVSATSKKIVVPSKATDLQPLAQLAFDLRTQGVGEYHTGIMGVLNNTDRTGSTAVIAKGLEDLVVSDQVFLNYKNQLTARLKAAKENVQVTDPGLFVSSVDSASTAAVNAYVAAIAGPAPKTGTTAGATSPAQAMKDYLKTKGIDSSAMSFVVFSESPSDSSWKVDTATETGSQPTYFLVHGSNGTWTVIDSGASLNAAQLKKDGAPADLKAPTAG